MRNGYLQRVRSLWTGPWAFFEDPGLSDPARAKGFLLSTGLILALGLGLWEAFTGGSLGMVSLVTGLLLLGLPLALLAGAFLWSAFVRFCGQLLGEDLSLSDLFPVVAFSMAGWLGFLAGPAVGKWMALSIPFIQFHGVGKVLGRTPWSSLALVGLPFSLAGVLMVLFIFIFKIF